MKFSRILLLMVIFVSIISCKNDDDTVEFTLNNTNLAGTYALTFFSVNREESFEFNGIPVMSNTSVVGDTFQVTTVFDDDGTYTISGEYRVIITNTVGGVTEVLDPEIIVLDEDGTYQINTNAQTITMSGLSELGAGSFDVELFNENALRITQTTNETTPDLTSVTISELRFERQ